MAHSLESWNKLYAQGRRGKYPNEMLIRFINSRFKEDRQQSKILDLGFGTGRHLVYLAEEGFLTYGIEYSANGVEIAKEWLKQRKLKASLLAGSFTQLPFDDQEFDAVIDIASMQHNIQEDVKAIVAQVHRVLKPGGYFFSYYKNKYDSLFKESKKSEGGILSVSGKAPKMDTFSVLTFMSAKEVSRLFSNFENVSIEKDEWTFEGMKKKVSHWVIIAQK